MLVVGLNTYIQPWEAHPTTMLERPAQHLYLTMGGPACHHVRKAQHSHLTMGGPA